MCPEELLLPLHSLPLPSQKTPFASSSPGRTQHAECPLGRSTRGREIIYQAPTTQPGNSVPAPRLLWGVMPQGSPPPQQSQSSPSPGHGWEPSQGQAEAAEKYRYRKRARFLPDGSSGTHWVTRAPAGCRASTDLNIWLCREAQPRLPGSCSIPKAPRHFPPQHRSLQKWLLCAKISQELQLLGGSSLATRREAGSKGLSLSSGCLLQIPPAQKQLPRPQQHGFISCSTKQHWQQEAGLVRPAHTSLQSSSEPSPGKPGCRQAPELKAGHASLLPSLLPRSRAT